MNRRELLLSTLSAAILAACGGSNDEHATKLLSSTARSSAAGPPGAVFNTARSAAFISSYMEVIFSQNMLRTYRAAPNTYFASLGFGAGEIADYDTLLMALPVLTSADVQTAIDINDVDYIFEICKSGTNTGRQPDYGVQSATGALVCISNCDFSIRCSDACNISY